MGLDLKRSQGHNTEKDSYYYTSYQSQLFWGKLYSEEKLYHLTALLPMSSGLSFTEGKNSYHERLRLLCKANLELQLTMHS